MLETQLEWCAVGAARSRDGLVGVEKKSCVSEPRWLEHSGDFLQVVNYFFLEQMRENRSENDAVGGSIRGRQREVQRGLGPKRVIQLVLGVEMMEFEVRIARGDALPAPVDRIARHIDADVAARRSQDIHELQSIAADAA